MATAPTTSTPFTAILSTAGSRKTTQLTQRAVAHVLAGHAKPEEILLTTLTRSAAAQLHERSVEQFLTQARAAGAGAATFLDLGHRLEHAAIGTLHSLGLEVLRRMAVVKGMPVEPKVLSAGAEKDLVQSRLDQLNAKLAASLFEHARRLGRHEPKPRSTQGVAFRDDVLDVVELRRRLRVRSRRQLMELCFFDTSTLATTLWPTHPIGTSALEPLEEYLSLVESHRGSGLTDEQVDKILRRGFWGALIELKKATDAGLVQRGQQIHSAHWFHEDCIAYAVKLAEAAHAVAVAYRREKSRRGLVDFHDQAEALRRYGWPDDLAFIGCDEVQDLTARQIKTAERLVAGSRHPQAVAVWIGDENQHLFGYEGASWTAAQAAIGRLGGAVTPVHDNHRSSPLLVKLFNALFPPPRPAQTPGRPLHTGEVTHVERWTLSIRDPDDDQHDATLRGELVMPYETRALAAGIADLLNRRSHLKPSDIAVVVRTNNYADHVIQALHALGIPVDASPRSLAETREGRIVVEALRLLADPSDTLAAAMVRHLLQDWSAPRDPTDWFWDGLRGGGPGHARIDVPGLSDLVRDRDLASRLSPTEAVHRVNSALGLVRRVGAWGAAAGRLRNLDGIVAVARSYEARCRAEQRPATIAGLAALFTEGPADDESSRHSRVATGGVTVTTTHSAKGLGWPVTIVGQCGWRPATGSSTFTIRDYEHVDPSGCIRRRPHVLPWAFGSHAVYKGGGAFTRNHFLPSGARRADLHLGPYGTAAAALPGSQAIAASDDEAERNNVFVACTRAESIVVFTDPRSNKIQNSARLDFLQPALDRLLSSKSKIGVPQPIPGLSDPGSLDYTRFEYAPASAAAVTPPPSAVVSAAAIANTITNFKAVQHSDPYPLEYPPADSSTPAPDGDYPRRFWNPSDEPASHTRGIDPATCAVVPLPGPPLPLRIAAGINRANDNAVGNAIHAFFAALPSLAAVASPRRNDLLREIARRCIAANGWRLPLDAGDLALRFKAFEDWLAIESLDVITEFPIVVPRNTQPATFWRGRIDALGGPTSGTPPGTGIRIIDHKSATGSSPKWPTSWLAEAGTYASCVPLSAAQAKIVLHLPLTSRVTIVTGRKILRAMHSTTAS